MVFGDHSSVRSFLGAEDTALDVGGDNIGSDGRASAHRASSMVYRNTHTFCGGLAQPGHAILEWDCDLIYQPLKTQP